LDQANNMDFAIGAAWIFSKENSIQKIVKWVLENSVLVMELRAMIKLRLSVLWYLRYNCANYQGIIGLQPTRLYNADFGWETNRKLELALETGF
jgi:hypothetical protein